jgi:hypothetical protein
MGERLLGAKWVRRHSRGLSFFAGGLFPRNGALTSRSESAWTHSTLVPHVAHAEGGGGGTEGVPDELEDTDEEETAEHALTWRLRFCPDHGGANGGAAAEQWYARGRGKRTAWGWGWGKERPERPCCVFCICRAVDDGGIVR